MKYWWSGNLGNKIFYKGSPCCIGYPITPCWPLNWAPPPPPLPPCICIPHPPCTGILILLKNKSLHELLKHCLKFAGTNLILNFWIRQAVKYQFSTKAYVMGCSKAPSHLPNDMTPWYQLWNIMYLKILWKMDQNFQKYSKLNLNFSWIFSMLTKNRTWCHDLKIAYGVKD